MGTDYYLVDPLTRHVLYIDRSGSAFCVAHPAPERRPVATWPFGPVRVVSRECIAATLRRELQEDEPDGRLMYALKWCEGRSNVLLIDDTAAEDEASCQFCHVICHPHNWTAQEWSGKPVGPRTLLVEGMVVNDRVDPGGDLFDLDGMVTTDYMEGGWLVNDCTVNPSITNIIGAPESIERRGGELVMKARVWGREEVEVLDARVPMGFAMAGVILEKEDLPDVEGAVGITLIKKCKLSSVALMPLSKITNPACAVRLVVKGVKNDTESGE
jgi:hypothetical protein